MNFREQLVTNGMIERRIVINAELKKHSLNHQLLNLHVIIQHTYEQ